MANQVTFASIKAKLIKVDFESIDGVSKGQEFSVEVGDEYILKSFKKSTFDVVYSRSINLVPEGLFRIKFIYDINFKLDDESIEHFNNDSEKLENFLKKRFAKIINEQDILIDISTLTSLLTRYGRFKPLLIAPQMKDEELKSN